MTRWTRSAAALAAAAAAIGLGAALGGAAPATAANASTKYLTIFRETTPSAIASGTVSKYGVTPASVLWFDNWASGNAFNTSEAKAVWAMGIMPHFTWEPWNPSLGVSDSAQIHLQDIVNGKWDSYIRSRGAEMASAGVPIMLRWAHEFDGNWYPWGIANNGNNPALYATAYRHVHDLVVAAGATNVQWVFTFNNNPSPNESWNSAAAAYPGDAYVDWIGIDGYNWGLAPSWDPSGNDWSSFNSLFSSAYGKARSIAPKRPVMIAEMASSEDGGSKAQWINDLSSVLNSGSYPDLKSIAWFDQNKEELWAADSSSASKAAFVSWVKQPYMNGSGTDLAKVAAQYKGTTTTTTTTRSSTTTTTSRTTSTTSRTTSTTSRTTSSTTQPSSTTTGSGGSKGCTASYSVQSSWGGGFVANVNVTAGSASISGWKVTLTLPGGTAITNIWNGVASGGSGTVTVTNQNYNGSVPASGSTSFGFQGSGTGTGTTASCTAS
jgi:hypothetical protein